MPFYFLPSANPAFLRDESSAGVIANLTRKGWQLTTPPAPGANETPQWDPVAKTWSLVANPPATPNYADLNEALISSALFNSMWNKMSPTITVSERTALPQAGGSNSLTLNTTASPTNNAYNGSMLLITGGTGNNEAFTVTAYDGPTRVASLVRISGNGSAVTLDATSRYRIYSLEQFFDGLSKVSGVFEIQRTYGKFSQILDRFAAYGDRGNATAIARFQSRLNEWVVACSFSVPDRDELRGLLATFAAARGYTVPT
jgi:hypothetical protein